MIVGFIKDINNKKQPLTPVTPNAGYSGLQSSVSFCYICVT